MNILHKFAIAGMGLATMAMGASAQQVPAGQPAQPVQPAQRIQPAQPAARPAQPAAAQPGGVPATEAVEAIENAPTPIDSLSDLQDTARLGFMIVDFNNDGLISQEEAINAANIVAGGFFFAADANGDGVVTQEEAQQVREQILQEQPILRVFIEEARRQAGQSDQQQNPYTQIASLLDGNNDKQLQATEVRGAVETAVTTIFAAADTNRDGQMSPTEINAAALAMAQAAGDASFRLADKDGNGAISQEEFQAALLEPANLVFGTIDANSDGQVSREEAEAARQVLMQQLMPQIPAGRIPTSALTSPNQGANR